MMFCPFPTRHPPRTVFGNRIREEDKANTHVIYVRRWAAGCWCVGGASGGASVTFLPSPTQNPHALNLPLSISTISPQAINGWSV